jgi:hypothetical protein
LKTFPAPGAQPAELTIAAYTWAGGPDLPVLIGGRHGFKPVKYRQKLFQLMLQHKPDLVVANGDHIYWDYQSWGTNPDNTLARKAFKLYLDSYDVFDESDAVLGTANEQTLIAVANWQLAKAYGVDFRSTPVAFITDDHDYFDNDDASPELVTFPPNAFHRQLRDVLQSLYFHELIAGDDLPGYIPGQFMAGGVALSKYYGAARFGDFFAGVFYDCGGQMSLFGEQAGLISAAVESWVVDQTRCENTQYFAHFPSHPMGWTAGKWREWSPDSLNNTSPWWLM